MAENVQQQASPAPPAVGAPPRGQALEPASPGATSLYDLMRVVLTDQTLDPQQKKTLIDELRKNSPASDRWTFRWAIWILGLVVLSTIAAIWTLSATGHEIPEGLVAIGSGAAGGLAGLLTPGRDRDNHGE